MGNLGYKGKFNEQDKLGLFGCFAQAVVIKLINAGCLAPLPFPQPVITPSY
jgi:hypothetical protein